MSLLERKLPEPNFVDRDVSAIVADVVAGFEKETGRTLYPAQVERLMANIIAYRESLLREAIQDAAKLNLVRYSRAPIIDMLGENIGVVRLPNEDDESLRQRIVRAPEQFSTAGSVGAYKFHALGADASITDVAIVTAKMAMQNGQLTSTNNIPPGVVHIYPLTNAGLPSTAIKAAVQSTCSADKVRPLTDYVQVLDPVAAPYNIRATLTLYNDADVTVALQQAQHAADQKKQKTSEKLGLDIVRSQWLSVLHVYGVYAVELQEPAADIVLEPHQWAQCTSVQISVGGSTDG